MGIKKGFASLKNAKKKADEARKERSGARTRDLYLTNDRQQALIWFNGSSEDEPCIIECHGVKKPPGPKGGEGFFETFICARGDEDHEGCVFCWAVTNGHKNVAKASPMSFANVFDMRWVHKRLNEEKTKASGGKYEKFDWFDCEGDADDEEPSSDCKFCRKKIPRERQGQKKLRQPMMHAEALDALNDELRKKCVSCGGKLKCLGWRKGKKFLPDLEDVEDTEGWEAEYQCKKCDDPVPGSIFQCPITMQRNGLSTKTSYSFREGAFEDPPDCVSASTPIDFDEALKPITADRMAEVLGIENPFGEFSNDKDKKKRKKAAGPYDDDEDDEDEDEDLFEDDKPKGKKKKASDDAEDDDE